MQRSALLLNFDGVPATCVILYHRRDKDNNYTHFYQVYCIYIYIYNIGIILLNKSSFYAPVARGQVVIYGNSIGIQFILLSYII